MYKFFGPVVRERFCSVSMFDLHVSCIAVIIVRFILSAWQTNNVSVASPVRWYCHFLQSAINWITGTRAFGSVNSLSVSSLIHPFPQLYFPHLRLCSLTWFSVECLLLYFISLFSSALRNLLPELREIFQYFERAITHLQLEDDIG